jgi:dihydroorotate dehydrogenase electron transfer subunit
VNRADRIPQLSRTTLGRPGDGPVRSACEVVDRRKEGSYLALSLAAPEIAERARPGQFVNVGVEARGSLLRRPFSIHRVSRQGPWAGTVDFVFSAHGPGTGWLGELGTHDVVSVVGPLGSSFRLPREGLSTLLVGGGYGTAPLFFLGELLTREGHRVDMIVGARTADRLFNTIEAKRMSASVRVTTDDGTAGIPGTVTDVLAQTVEDCGTQVVYACGPMPMLRAVAVMCADIGVACQVAVEEHMACGVGVCWTCVVPVAGKDGAVRMKRSCLDGPVFNGARIAWDASRWAVEEPHGEPAGEGEVEEFTAGQVTPDA